jgi:hypothetical protein
VTEVLPLKISYEWRFGDYPVVGLVTFELRELGEATVLNLTTIVLEDFPDVVPEFQRESCLAGWRFLIRQSLKEYLERC